MKINEVEQKAGITKKNIRFYEEQGLLTPRRNAENGYRDYCEADVATLQQIKLMRKLDVPIEEIRQMQSGKLTVGDAMRRQSIAISRQQRNLQQSAALCEELQTWEIPLSAVDAEELLGRMAQMEQQGTLFQNRQEQDVRVQYATPVVVTCIMVALMAALCGILIWAYLADPANAPPFLLILVFILIFAAIGVGAVIALIQRIQEIQKGEMEDARKY